jgi:hypothetical protein
MEQASLFLAARSARLTASDHLADRPLSLRPDEAHLQLALTELLSFFVENHSHRSQYFILSGSINNKVACLLSARDKRLRHGPSSVRSRRRRRFGWLADASSASYRPTQPPSASSGPASRSTRTLSTAGSTKATSSRRSSRSSRAKPRPTTCSARPASSYLNTFARSVALGAQRPVRIEPDASFPPCDTAGEHQIDPRRHYGQPRRRGSSARPAAGPEALL